jgi:uncharacterized protein YydD (DUF2326 family)
MKEAKEDNLIKIELSELREFSPELAQEVFKLWRELMLMREVTKEAKISEREAWIENMKLTNRIAELEKEIEKLNSYITELTRKNVELSRQVKDLKGALQQADMRMSIYAISYMELMASMEKLYTLVAEKYAEDIPTVVREELKKDIEFLIEQFGKIAPAPKEEKEEVVKEEVK